MGNVTKHNWDVYQQRCHSKNAEWLLSLTVAESVALYQDLHRLARSQQDDSPGWRRLEQKRWEQKVVIRRKLNAAFQRLDDTNGP